jgi:hypothetical protein
VLQGSRRTCARALKAHNERQRARWLRRVSSLAPAEPCSAEQANELAAAASVAVAHEAAAVWADVSQSVSLPLDMIPPTW